MDSGKILVGKIENGVVIDHISSCKALTILNLLNPSSDAMVVLVKNVPSTRYSKKDLIKIEGEYLTSTLIDIIALMSPNATVNIIHEGSVKEKHRVQAPKELFHVIDCKNPACPSRGQFSRFTVNVAKPVENSYFDCAACGHRIFYEQAIQEILKKASAGILISKERIQRELLDLLVKKGGLRLGDRFKLKSGRVSPYFINLGALTDGESLSRLRWILAGFTLLLTKENRIPDFDFVFGPAYKGINLAALTCEGVNEYGGLNKRYLYDRKETKTYGDMAMDKDIVGGEYYRPSQKILVVDDTITTGQTKLESINKLSSLSNNKIVGVVVCVDRQETAEGKKSGVEEVKQTLGVDVFPVLTATDIYHLVKPILTEEQRKAWIDYYAQYGTVSLK